MIGSALRKVAIAVVAAGALAACSSSSPRLSLDSTPSTTAGTTTIPNTFPPPTTEGVTTPTVATSTTLPTATTGPVTATTTPGSTVAAGPATTAPPPLTPANAPLVTWNGKAQYIHGANLPWYNFGTDFGGGPTGGGVSDPASAAAIDPALAAAHAAGMNVVRWWLFPGEPTQFTLDAGGLPTGFKDTVFQDIDAALALGRAHQIAYTFTLFSDPTSIPTAWMTTPAGRDRLTLVLAGLFTHYANNPTIMTWDVVNEPEFAVLEKRANADDVRAFIAAVATAVHQTTSTLVSVGGARLDTLPLLVGLGLDYYTIHWYDPMKDAGQCLACVSYADIRDGDKIDKPIVVGEFYGPVGFGDRFAMWHLHGYAGALAWSLMPAKTSDHFAIDLDAAAAFAKSIGLT